MLLDMHCKPTGNILIIYLDELTQQLKIVLEKKNTWHCSSKQENAFENSEKRTFNGYNIILCNTISDTNTSADSLFFGLGY